jgi:hypothetical protein
MIDVSTLAHAITLRGCPEVTRSRCAGAVAAEALGITVKRRDTHGAVNSWRLYWLRQSVLSTSECSGLNPRRRRNRQASRPAAQRGMNRDSGIKREQFDDKAVESFNVARRQAKGRADRQPDPDRQVRWFCQNRHGSDFGDVPIADGTSSMVS